MHEQDTQWAAILIGVTVNSMVTFVPVVGGRFSAIQVTPAQTTSAAGGKGAKKKKAGFASGGSKYKKKAR